MMKYLNSKKLYFVILFFLFNFSLKANIVPRYILDIYNKVFSSINNGDLKKPKLYLVDDTQSEIKEVATYSPQNNSIRIGQSFINLTRKFGKDSNNVRAHVFCHELAHLVLNHGYASIIGTGFASKEINKEFKKSKIAIEDKLGELEADQWAFFYAYISGFQTNNIVPTLLDSIYNYYKLTDESLSRYPKLAERKKFAIASSIKMKSMCESFEFANLALLHGDIKLSIAVYEAIKNEGFKSREIYTNLGTASLLYALKNKGYPEVDYHLPLQIDFDTRLNQDATRGEMVEDQYEQFIKYAIDNFLMAVKIDPDYFPAYFNLAMASWISNDTLNLFYNLEKGKRITPSDQVDNILIFEAIMNYKSTDNSKKLSGYQILDQLSKMGNRNAIRNINLINNTKTEKNTSTIISKYAIINQLPTNFLNSRSILDSTFTRDLYRTLTCKEVHDTLTYRKWKFINDEESFIVLQYFIPPRKSNLTFLEEKELIENADFSFENVRAKYLIFQDIIMVIENNKIIQIHLLKS